MLVPSATNPIPLERALRGGARGEGLTATISGDRATGGGVVARPLEGPFSHAADAATLLAAQEARKDSNDPQGPATDPQELSRAEGAEVRRMQRRDAEVRRHELAHAAAGGPQIGIAEFKYQRGPDGKLYAVGGRVSIDVAPASTPAATIRKMDAVIRAATAPVDPSMEDRAVAVLASQIRQKAINEGGGKEEDAGEDSPHTPAATLFAGGDPIAGPTGVPRAEAAAYQSGAGRTRDARQGFDIGT